LSSASGRGASGISEQASARLGEKIIRRLVPGAVSAQRLMVAIFGVVKLSIAVVQTTGYPD
jgi:hypothetical protein